MDMEKKSPLRDVMNSTMEKVREMVDANNIVGAPITTPDGVTLIPISRVSSSASAAAAEITASRARTISAVAAAPV